MHLELYLSQETKKIGYQLISELNIQNGSELSNFLNVNNCYNNHEAKILPQLEIFQKSSTTAKIGKMIVCKSYNYRITVKILKLDKHNVSATKYFIQTFL